MKRPLLGIFLLALIPRLILLGVAVRHPEASAPSASDAETYMVLASHLWSDHRLTDGIHGTEIFRTPGYPLFLAPFMGLFQNPIFPILLAQTLLGALTVVLLWLVLTQEGSWAGAWVGAGILALDWVVLTHTPILMSETLFLFFIVAGLCAAFYFLRDPSFKGVAGGGLLWSFAAIIKPVSLYFPILIALVLPQKRRYLAVFLITAYLFPALWMGRNYREAHFIGLSSVSSVSLLRYPAASIEALRKGISWDEAEHELMEGIRQETPDGTQDPAALNRAYSRRALTIIGNHPFLFLYINLKGAVGILRQSGIEMLPRLLGDNRKFWLDAGATGMTGVVLRAYPLLIPIAVIYLLALASIYVTFLLGLRAWWKTGRRAQALLIGLGAFYFLAVAAHQGYHRYRIPMMPFLAAGVAGFVSWRKESDT